MSWEYNQYLAHHGIKGQRWGIRRYQNEDGTLTEEGRKRLASEYEQSSVNSTAMAALFRRYSDPKLTTTPEAAEHNRQESIKSEKVSKYSAEMSRMFSSQKNIKVSDLEDIVKNLAKKYDLDADWLLREETQYWKTM